jgi:hypothetical protein
VISAAEEECEDVSGRSGGKQPDARLARWVELALYSPEGHVQGAREGRAEGDCPLGRMEEGDGKGVDRTREGPDSPTWGSQGAPTVPSQCRPHVHYTPSTHRSRERG